MTTVEIIDKTYLGLKDLERVAGLVLAPTRQRVELLIQTARDQTLNDPKQGAEAARGLIEQSYPSLTVYELFHGKEAHQKTELFDEVAVASVDCLVTYQKTTDDNHAFVELLRRTIPFATSTEIRRRLENNINIGEGNIKRQSLEQHYAELQRIQESKEKACQRLETLKRKLVPVLSVLTGREGGGSQLVHELSNALAFVLRGISIDAYNNEQDYHTAIEATKLAASLARDPELAKRLREDLETVMNTQQALARVKRQKAASITVIVCICIGGFLGAFCGNVSVGIVLGLFAGVVVSRFVTRFLALP